jgi:hypothetical protein
VDGHGASLLGLMMRHTSCAAYATIPRGLVSQQGIYMRLQQKMELSITLEQFID